MMTLWIAWRSGVRSRTLAVELTEVTTADEALGLGLAIAKGIIEAHGSTVAVASRLGEGAEFSFTLRLVQSC